MSDCCVVLCCVVLCCVVLCCVALCVCDAQTQVKRNSLFHFSLFLSPLAAGSTFTQPLLFVYIGIGAGALLFILVIITVKRHRNRQERLYLHGGHPSVRATTAQELEWEDDVTI